jgi:hypothetical protein
MAINAQERVKTVQKENDSLLSKIPGDLMNDVQNALIYGLFSVSDKFKQTEARVDSNQVAYK